MEDEILDGDGKLTVSQFAKSVKQKYPQYANTEDSVLVEKMIAKYPQYKDKINFDVQNPTQQTVEPKKDVAEVSGGSESPLASSDSSLESQSGFKLPNISEVLGDVDSPIARKYIEESAASVVDNDPKKKREIQELAETGNKEVAEDLREKYISSEVASSSSYNKLDDLKEIVKKNTITREVEDKRTPLEVVYDDLSVRPNNKYKKEDTDTGEMHDIYGDTNKYGIDMQDFAGYVEQGNSNIIDIKRAGYFSTDTTDILLDSKEEEQLRETAKHNTLSIYINDRLANLNGKYLGLTKKGDSEQASEVREEIMKTVKGYSEYVKNELPNYHRVQQQKLVDEYEEYTNTKDIGGIKKTFNTSLGAGENLIQGFTNAAGDTSAYLLDLIGADESSEYQRMINEYNKEFDSNSLDYGIVEGYKVNHKGVNYRVTEDNRIIDVDLGKEVTSIANKIGLDTEAIIAKGKASNNKGVDYSTSGLIKQGSNVLGNLAFQIAATRGVNGTLGLTTKAKTLISSMAVQSGMVASSTYEETLSQLRKANINDETAKGEALDLSLKLGTVAAITSIISPNSSAIGVTNKAVDKGLVKKLAASYVSGGKDAFKKTLVEQLKQKGVIMAKEGIEEAIQEMTELVAQKNFNATINQNLDKDVLDTNISKAEIIETFVLSTATGSLAAGFGKTRSDFKDRLSIINQLSKDVNSSTKYIDQLQQADAITKEAADRIKKNVVNYTKYSNKIPQDIDITRVEPLLDKLDERTQLELNKKNQDPAFHARIKEDIAKVDADIDFILNGDNSLVVSTKKDLKKTIKNDNWGILTAENPNATEASQEENKQYNKAAKRWLSDRGYQIQDVEGNYAGNVENSFFVPDLNIKDALEFAKEFNQESIATNKGLVYQDGSYSPRVEGDSVGGDFEGDHSTIRLPEGKVNFQVNYDSSNRVYEQNQEEEVVTESVPLDAPEITPRDKKISKVTKKGADKIRKLKVNSSVKESMSKLQSSPAGIFTFAWDGAVETVAKSFELSGDIAQAINDGLVELKNSEWYNQLSDRGKKLADRKFADEFHKEAKKYTPKETFKDKVSQKYKSISQEGSQKFVDVFSNINEAVKALDGARTFWKKQGLYESKTAALVDAMLARVEVGIKAISKSKFKLEAISDYMYAKHAIDRNKHVSEEVDGENPFGSGMTDIEANSILDSVNEQERVEIEKLAETFYDLIEDSRKIMVKTGLMSQEAVDKLKMSNNTYVPLTGFADESIELGANVVAGKKVNVKGKEFKGVTGRSTKANNIIANIIKQYTDIAIRGNKNELLQSFDEIKGNNLKEDIPFKIYTQENLPKTKTVGADGKVRYTKDAASIDDSYVGFKKNGKQMYIAFDNPILAQNLNRATDATIDWATRYLGKMNRVLSSAFTQYNPSFMIPNFFRDFQTALINLKAQADINPDLNGKDLSAKVAKNTFKAIRVIHSIERGKINNTSDYAKYYMEEFKPEGTAAGWANRMTLKELTAKVNAMEKMMSGKLISKSTLTKGFESFLSVLDNANVAIENGVRLASYVEGRKSGMSKLDAASLAKELTINFNRRGEMGGHMNTLYLFFNASVQGTVNLKNNMGKFKTYTDSKGKERKTLNRGQKAAIGVMLSSIGLTLYNMGASGEDEESGLNIYDSIPDYEKERNLIIMKPDGKSYFKIPLPYGYNLFSNMGTMLSESVFGERKASSASEFMLGSTIGSFSPFSSPKRDDGLIEAAYFAAPTLAKPVGMLFENKDFFGSQVYRENFPTAKDKLAPATLGSKRTADIYKNAAIWLNSVSGGNAFEEGKLGFHPDKMQFLVNYFGGGALKFLKDSYGVGETLLDQQKGAEITLDPRDLPLLRKIYGEDTSFPEMQIYYNVKEKYRRRLNYLKSKEGLDDHLDEPTERGNLYKLEAYYKASDKQLKELRKQEKVILLMKDGIKRAEELEKLDVQKRKVYANHIRRYLKVKERLTRDYE